METGRVLAFAVGVGVAAIAAVTMYQFFSPQHTLGADRWLHMVLRTEGAYTAALAYGEAEARKGSPGAQISYEQPQLSVYSAPWPPKLPPPDLTLKDLSDQAQARLIEAEAEKPDGVAQLRENLAQGFATKAAATDALQDPFKFDRTLIATVTKGTMSQPGDRLVWTRIFIKPTNFSFMNYSIDSAVIETEKVASVQDKAKNSLSATLGLPQSAVLAASIAPDLEHSREVSADLDQQYQKLGIDIQPDFVRIYRESERGKDVIGNTLINLSLIADSKMATQEIVLIGSSPHLYDGVKPLDEHIATLDIHPQQLIAHCPLIARVWMVYERRDIASGGEHYDEGAQSVSLVRDASAIGSDNAPGIVSKIMDADSVSPAIWQISAEDGSGQVVAGVDPKAPRQLLFTDYGVATMMAHWLRESSAKSIAKVTLSYPSAKGLVATKRQPSDAEKRICPGS